MPAEMPAPKAATASTSRLAARISSDPHSSLKRAAQIQGHTMTNFVVATVQKESQKAIEQAQFVRLSAADQEATVLFYRYHGFQNSPDQSRTLFLPLASDRAL
jgi:uncharacterized protein (DUF1778 family)